MKTLRAWVSLSIKNQYQCLTIVDPDFDHIDSFPFLSLRVWFFFSGTMIFQVSICFCKADLTFSSWATWLILGKSYSLHWFGASIWWAFPGGAVANNLPANVRGARGWAWSLGWEDPLEKEMETHSSILAWEVPWTEEPGVLQSMGS